MAAEAVLTKTVKEALDRDGFFILQEEKTGERVSEMELQGFPFDHDDGVAFCRYVLKHQLLQPVVEDTFDYCKGAHYFNYAAKPGRIFCFMRGSAKKCYPLIIHLYAKGSEAEYWSGSHKIDLSILPKEKIPEALLELDENVLIKAGCTPKKVEFTNGGLVITDARVAFERRTLMIAYGFFPLDMMPPEPMRMSDDKRDKVKEMETDRIGVNVEFYSTRTSE